MAGDDPLQTDPVTAAFARPAATPVEARYQPAGKRPDQPFGVLNGLIMLGILLAVAISTYALLNI
jgi:hypothetical protein